MGFLDRFRSKARDTVDQHGDKVSQGIEKAGDMVDEKTGGKYADKVDTAQEKTTGALENLDGQDDDLTNPPPPPESRPEPPASPATEKEPPPAP